MSAAAPQSGSSPFLLLSYRDGRLLWAGRAVSDFGSGATIGSLFVLLSHWSNSARLVAVNGLVQVIPALLVLSFLGGIVDHHDRKVVMIASDLARAVLVAGLIFSGPSRIPLVFGLTAAQAAVQGFFDPANSALLPLVVPPASRPSANGLLQASSITADLLGMSLGGTLAGLTVGHVWIAFAVDAATFACSAAFTSRIRTPGRSLRSASQDQPSKAKYSLRTGFGVVRQSPALLTLIVGASVAQVGFGVVNVVLAPLLLLVLHARPFWVGPSMGALVVAGVLTGVLAGRLARRFHDGKLVVAGLGGTSLSIALLALAPTLAVALPALALMGASQALLGVGGSTAMQTLTRDATRGSVSALTGASGQLARLVGIIVVAVFGATYDLRGLLLGSATVVLVGTFATRRLATDRPYDMGAAEGL